MRRAETGGPLAPLRLLRVVLFEEDDDEAAAVAESRWRSGFRREVVLPPRQAPLDRPRPRPTRVRTAQGARADGPTVLCESGADDGRESLGCRMEVEEEQEEEEEEEEEEEVVCAVETYDVGGASMVLLGESRWVKLPLRCTLIARCCCAVVRLRRAAASSALRLCGACGSERCWICTCYCII